MPMRQRKEMVRMKKETRKFVGFLLSSVMMLSCLPVSNAAAEFEGFTDNFDGYETTNEIFGWQSTTTDGVWTLSDIWPGNAYDNHYGGSQVEIESGTDNVLTLTGYGDADTHKVAFNLAKEKYDGIGNNVKMNVSVKKTGNTNGGVRFLVSEDEQSYYEFQTDWSSGWYQRISKVENGVKEELQCHVMQVSANEWVDVEFYNVKNTIYWTITNTATGVSNSGKYTDLDGLPAKGENAKYQLWTLNNGGGKEQFDDFSLTDVAGAFNGFEDDISYAGTGWNTDYSNAETNNTWIVDDNDANANPGATAIIDGNFWLYGMNSATATITATLNEAKYLNAGDSLSFKVSLMQRENAVGGIRFMVSEDGKSYYEISHAQNWSLWSFNKVVDGVSETLKTGQMFFVSGNWFDLEIANSGNTIYFCVTNNEGAKADYFYTDPEMLSSKGENGKYQLFVLNNDSTYKAPEYFDNISLKELKFDGYSDNFDSYATTGWMDGHTNTETNGNWLISDTSDNEGGLSTASIDLKVPEVEGDNIFRIYGMRWGVTYGENTVMATLNPANYFGLGDNVSMKVSTMRNGNTDGGIRFMVSSDGDSYYEIKHNWGGGWWYLNKVVDGALTTLQSSAMNNIGDGRWYDLEISNLGNKIFWSVTDKTTGVKESHTYEDANMLPERGADAKYQLWTISNGGNIPENFDNFSLTEKSDKYYENGTEPDDVLYQNAAEKATVEESTGKVVYSFDEAVKVRRIITSSISDSDVLVYVADSKDAAESSWTLIGNAADGDFLNKTSVQSAKAVILKSQSGAEFSAEDVVILTDDAALSYTLAVQESVKLYPRVAGVDQFNAAWTVADEKIAVSENGEIKLIGYGSTSATYGKYTVTLSAAMGDVFTEDDFALYVDASYGKPIYTFDGGMIIDLVGEYFVRHVLVSGGLDEVEFYVSDDNVNWTYISDITPDEDYANWIDMPCSYVKLVGEVSEVTLAAEAENVNVRLGSSLKLLPYSYGQYDSEASLSTESEIYTPKAVAENVEITADFFVDSAVLNVNAISAYEFTENADGTMSVELATPYYKEGAKFVAAFYGAGDKFIGVTEVTSDCDNYADVMTLTFTPQGTPAKVKLMCLDGGFDGLAPLTEASVYVK